jgi:ABC-type nitrate/sulfonate/bicarbonate transport system substrate-binding protein
MQLRRLIGIALSAALFALVAGHARAADAPKIRIGWIAAPANLAPILFAKPGIGQHVGKSYELEPIRFNGSPPQITALNAGELDIALLAYSSFALAIENAKMDDLRVIADDFQGNVPGYFEDGYLVLNDSPIKTIEELKGKILATNGVGGAIDIALRVAMRNHKMEDKRDYVIVEAGLPSMKAMLMERKVDLIPAVIPFAYDPELKKNSRMLFTQGSSVGTTQTLLWAARTGFLQKNRAAMVDFMEDVVRARRFYLDPANHKEAVEIVSKFTKQPPQFFEGWMFTKGDNYRDPNAMPNLQAMQTNINRQKELGFLKNDVDVPKYADVSITKEAAERVKKAEGAK